ncbi:hypothetical protein Trydic_g14738 [Trypoxylus dichotomus]
MTYFKNVNHFIDILHQRHVESTNTLISFDITSLFTKVLCNETVDIIRNKHQVENYVINQRYRQTEGVPMRSSLSPTIANISIGNFETRTWTTPNTNPSYDSDIWIILPPYEHKVKTSYWIFSYTTTYVTKSYLPYNKDTTGKIHRISQKHQIEAVFFTEKLDKS